MPRNIQDDIDTWFTYHAPNAEQAAAYSVIRTAAKEFAEVIVANTPASADQTAALRKVREAVMTANAAIACAPAAAAPLSPPIDSAPHQRLK